MSRDTPVKLRIPPQDLHEFDHFPLSVEGVRQWTNALPVTSSSQVALQLRDAIARLNRVELTPELRFKLLETLRPALLVAVASLSRRFLRQPLVMPVAPRQMAEMADHLYNLACTGYTIVAAHAIQRRESVREVNAAKLACESIHRALRCAGAGLLQTFQLYRPVPLRGWLTLHQLYALAEGQRLTQLQVEDRLSGSGTVATAYLQALMLGCCKPNTMRQNDLAAIYRGLREWGALLTVGHDPEHKGLFLVDLDGDRPAMYRQLYKETPGPRMRYIDTTPLVEHLQKLYCQPGPQEVVFDKDTVVNAPLIAHFINALSKMSMRNFARQRTSKAAWIGTGLSTCHYLLAGEKSFEEVLYGSDYQPGISERISGNPFLRRHSSGDVWQGTDSEEQPPGVASNDDNPLDHEVMLDRETLAVLQGEEFPGDSADPGRYPVQRTSMYDASPGGYSLEWTDAMTGNITTGEIVCMREDDSARWALAAVRWVSQLENSRTLVGLELLSPGATPYGACMQRSKKGEEANPMRALLLPEIKLVGQAPTLILPRAGFRERQKISLVKQGEEIFIQLLRQVAITSSFAQFEFRYAKQLGEILAEDKSRPRDSSFDSLWTNI